MMAKKSLTGVSITLAFVGTALAQEAGSKSINTGGEKGAYHTLF